MLFDLIQFFISYSDLHKGVAKHTIARWQMGQAHNRTEWCVHYHIQKHDTRMAFTGAALRYCVPLNTILTTAGLLEWQFNLHQVLQQTCEEALSVCLNIT